MTAEARCHDCGEPLWPPELDAGGDPLWDPPLCLPCAPDDCGVCGDAVTPEGLCVSCDEDQIWGGAA